MSPNIHTHYVFGSLSDTIEKALSPIPIKMRSGAPSSSPLQINDAPTTGSIINEDEAPTPRTKNSFIGHWLAEAPSKERLTTTESPTGMPLPDDETNEAHVSFSFPKMFTAVNSNDKNPSRQCTISGLVVLVITIIHSVCYD